MPRTLPAVGAVLAVLLASCTSPRTAGPRPMPPDFALEITLKATPAADPDLEPAWYVLDPDGTLRAALGERSPASPLPPVVRRLNDTQAASIWNQVSATRYDALPPPGDKAGDPARDLATDPTAQPPRAMIAIAADRRRRAFVVPADADADRLRALVRPLRALAWIRPPAER